MMDRKRPDQDVSAIAREILGYLNFSSGKPDPRFLGNVSTLFAAVAIPKGTPAWRAVGDVLRAELQAASGTTDAFRHVEQADAVLRLVFDAALPAYREFHRDLLFHQTDETLFQPFFVGRMCEAVLRQGGPWDETDRIVPAVVRQLNDYLGHRPVAVLRTERKIQPYDHEWVRPIPLWIRGAGPAVGPYRELIEAALVILDATDPAILLDAMFSLDQLDELAVDPRAYDFDHPVNKRPNYLFGQWDMNHLDHAGRCGRFVLQQVALDAMLERLEHRGQLAREEVLFEEATVLAGTMLMGSGVSGNRPDAHDSTVTLGTLLPKIAAYRDAFYEQLLRQLSGPHAERLRAEAVALRQPLGAARQHFNHCLAARRARQLQHVHLAQLFAALGCDEQARRHAEVVPTASARMTCQMRCRMSAAHLAIEQNRLPEAAAQLPPVEDLLLRAIECGAMVDPWNILGFGGQYSLFPAVENSVQDHRVDDLLDMISDIFMLYIEVCKAAAAAGQTTLQQKLAKSLGALARWWDQFASVEIGSVEGVSGQAAVESAESVAAALRAWHEGGASAGDVAFWRGHVEHFRGPKAYALVVDTLLDHGDFVAAMALLVQWLSQAVEIPLVEEDFSFHDLALSWMEDLWREDANAATGKADVPALPAPRMSAAQRWGLARKFLDYLEANADEYWQTPRFEMAAEMLGEDAGGFGLELRDDLEEEEEEEEDEDNLFGAAYEHVTYRDTTDDGVEGEMYETGPSATEFELVGEAERIFSRLSFLGTVAQLWKIAAMASARVAPHDLGEGVTAADRDQVLAGWLDDATRNHRELLELMDSVHRHRIPSPHGGQESLLEYERRRSVKETLLEEIVQTCVEMADAARMIRASMGQPPAAGERPAWERLSDEALAALLRGQPDLLRRVLPDLLESLADQPLLYVALARGGDPRRIAASRGRQCVLRHLLSGLPRLGMLAETCRLLETAQLMEAQHLVGPGAITEFDAIFEVGCNAIVRCLVVSSAGWGAKRAKKRAAAFSHRANSELVDHLEHAVEALLRCWLVHSRRVRLSVLESVSDPQQWRGLKQFIETYGGDLFTQQFLSLGNVRGILHQGVAAYLQTLREEAQSEEPIRLVADLDAAIEPEEAAHWLSVALEAVLENYAEYIDYNSITTQSDRGEMLYTLLDFLRLRAHYERLAWNLRPVMLAHQILVRCGRDEAAEIWRRAVASRTAPLAQEHLERFDRLCKKYGMHLPSIVQRLSERFVRPMEVDQLCALMRPAVEELRTTGSAEALLRFEQAIDRFTAQPSGAGYELPGWLDALERELDEVGYDSGEQEQEPSDGEIRVPQVRLSLDEAVEQIRRMHAERPKWELGDI